MKIMVWQFWGACAKKEGKKMQKYLRERGEGAHWGWPHWGSSSWGTVQGTRGQALIWPMRCMTLKARRSCLNWCRGHSAITVTEETERMCGTLLKWQVRDDSFRSILHSWEGRAVSIKKLKGGNSAFPAYVYAAVSMMAKKCCVRHLKQMIGNGKRGVSRQAKSEIMAGGRAIQVSHERLAPCCSLEP